MALRTVLHALHLLMQTATSPKSMPLPQPVRTVLKAGHRLHDLVLAMLQKVFVLHCMKRALMKGEDVRLQIRNIVPTTLGVREPIKFGCAADAGAATYTCGDHVVAVAEAHTVATALAEATAIAVSQVYATCKLDENTWACASGSAYIKDSAYAVAKVLISAACVKEFLRQVVSNIAMHDSGRRWGRPISNSVESLLLDPTYLAGHQVSNIRSTCRACSLVWRCLHAHWMETLVLFKDLEL
jgi:hypothetical protein